jgi:hypothetical protein
MHADTMEQAIAIAGAMFAQAWLSHETINIFETDTITVRRTDAAIILAHGGDDVAQCTLADGGGWDVELI